MMDRKLIRKLVKNIYSEARYIDTMMELRDWEEKDSAIALTKEENTEIMIMLSQADYLKDYLNNSIDDKVTKENINDNSYETMKEEIRKAATGIHQVYTKLLDAGFNSNTAINIMIAMISVTKI